MADGESAPTGDTTCEEHRPVELTSADTGEVIGSACGNCGAGWVNVAAFAGRTHIPIDPIPSRSLLGEVVEGARAIYREEWTP